MAYAVVIGFMNNMNRLKDPDIYPEGNAAYLALRRDRTIDELVEVPLEKILQELDTKNDQRFDAAAINGVDAEIRKAVWRVEDAAESYALHHSLRPSNCEDACNHRKHMENEISHFHRTATMLQDKFKTLLSNPLPEEDEVEEGDVSPIPSKPAAAILLSDLFDKILSMILDPDYRLKTVTLVGMAGIGKTHLARDVYQHLAGVRRLDSMAWVRVGQKRTVKNIIVDVLAQTELKPRKLFVNKSMFALSMLLRNILNGRRCFVVLDDVWSKVVCFDIVLRLQEAGVKRVLLTTRLGRANDYDNNTNQQMRFLSNEESWDLLWQNVFVDESSFPAELEKVGRKIAEGCEGLPLLILAVAEILRRDEKTEEHWNKVESRKSTTFTDAYDKISQVMLLSYDYLPQHLKPCFLYMGVFPQTSEIPLLKLIDLFTVEDFVKPEPSDTLAYFVLDSLNKLILDSLVIVCKLKSCKLHSAYWYSCVKVARENQFFHVLKKMCDGSPDRIEGQRRLCIQNNMLFGIKEVSDSMATVSTVRSLLCTGKYHEYPVPICFNLILLRVLDAVAIRLYEFPVEAVKLLLLRYLALTHHGKVPSSISSLQHLQFLIISRHHNVELLGNSTSLPKEIWGMQQLEHLQIKGHDLPDPSDGAGLPKLSTLHVNARSCTEAVFSSTPKMKKLVIKIELQPDANDTGMSCLEHVGLLSELESLKCAVVNPWVRSRVVPPPRHLSNLPASLTKLSLNGLGYPWKYTEAIGSLLWLQELKLRCSAFQGPEWKITTGCQFRNVTSLLLEDLDVADWKIDVNHCFPILRRLTIRHCFKLKEIPQLICSIHHSLMTTEVIDCSPSLVAYALQMQDEGRSSNVVIDSSWKL